MLVLIVHMPCMAPANDFGFPPAHLACHRGGQAARGLSAGGCCMIPPMLICFQPALFKMCI